MKESTKKQVITIAILLVFLGSSLTYAVISTVPEQNQVQSDWRAMLIITIFNEQYPIPAGIGTNNQTYSKLFTINSNGIVYKTGDDSATVGEFFTIWGESFNSTCILSYCNTENNSMRMYVNNKENFDYDLYTINNNDVIWIDYR
jgi:hypothetical protein